MKKINLDNLKETLRKRSASPSDFPSFEHQVAWEIADYFNEPYGFWVRKVASTKLLAGQVLHELNVLKGKRMKGKDKVKMLMVTMFPKSSPPTIPK